MTHLPRGAHHFWDNYVALNIISLCCGAVWLLIALLFHIFGGGVRYGMMVECMGFGARQAWVQICLLALWFWASNFTSLSLTFFIYKITVALGTLERPRKVAAIFFTVHLSGEDKMRWVIKEAHLLFIFQTVPCGWTTHLWTFSLGSSSLQQQVTLPLRTSVSPVLKWMNNP